MFDQATRAEAVAALVQRSTAVESAKLGEARSKSYSLDEIKSGSAADDIKKWLSSQVWKYPPKQPSLYSLSASDIETADLIANAFPGDQPYGVLGYRIPPKTQRQDQRLTLYVGSSEEVTSRLRQHLGAMSRKTYALHMKRWIPDGNGSVLVRVQAIKNLVDRQLRLDLEQALWRKMRPMFGRVGGF